MADEDDFEDLVDDDDEANPSSQPGTPMHEDDGDDEERLEDPDHADVDDEADGKELQGVEEEDGAAHAGAMHALHSESRVTLEYNKKRYHVPPENIVRDHKRPIFVPDGERLSEFRRKPTKEAWGRLDPVCIVVATGKLDKASEPDEDKYIWYVRVAVEERACTAEQYECDSNTIVPVPRPVAAALYKQIQDDPDMSQSTLVTTFAPYKANDKSFDPVHNGWQLCDAASCVTAEVRRPRRPHPNAPATTKAAARSAKKARAEVGEPQPLKQTANRSKIKPSSKAARTASPVPRATSPEPADSADEAQAEEQAPAPASVPASASSRKKPPPSPPPASSGAASRPATQQNDKSSGAGGGKDRLTASRPCFAR